MKSAVCCMLASALLSCHREGESRDPSAAAVATIAGPSVTAPSSSASAATAIAPSASATPTSSASSPMFSDPRFGCVVSSGSTRMNLHIDPDAGAGTLSIDGAETRRLDVVVRSSNLYFFAGYGEGDEKPVLEVLTPGKSLVAHLGSSGDYLYLYLDIRAKGVDPGKRLRCD